MRAVLPREVHAQRAALAPRFVELGRRHFVARELEEERRALLGDWHRHGVAPVGWLEAPDALDRGFALEERRQRLLGGTDREIVHAAGGIVGDGPCVVTGAFITWPHEVLDYRSLWDPYVMGTARAAKELATTAHPLEGSNLTQELFAGELTGFAKSITSSWNAHADAPDHELLTQAGDFLADYQRVVQRIASFYQPEILKLVPSAKLPKPPFWRLQVPVVSSLEDAKIVGHGVLQILGIGASGALEALDDTGRFIARTVDKVTDHIPVLAMFGIVAGFVALKAMASR